MVNITDAKSAELGCIQFDVTIGLDGAAAGGPSRRGGAGTGAESDIPSQLAVLHDQLEALRPRVEEQ